MLPIVDDFENLFPKKVSTPFGEVFLRAFEKENHRDKICQILSEEFENCASNLVIPGEGKRPFFQDSLFDANWSHSGNLCVLAFSESAQVGIDVEFLRPVSFKFVERFFHQDETVFLSHFCDSKGVEKISDEIFLKEFFRLWCRKEAFYKCSGGSFFKDALGISLLDSPKDHFVLDFEGTFRGKWFKASLVTKKRS